MAAPDTQVISTNGTEPVSEPLAVRPVPTPAPTPAPAPPTQPAPEQQQGPFTVDQVAAWAEGKRQPAEQQGPFTVDQVAAWADQKAGPTWLNLGRLAIQRGLQAGVDAVAGLFGLEATGGRVALAEAQPSSIFQGQSVEQVQSERDKLQAQLDQNSKDIDQRSESGQMGGEEILGASLYERGLRQRIAGVDEYIKAGGNVPYSLPSQALKNFSDFFSRAQRTVHAAGETGIPQITGGQVPVQVERTPAGAGASIVGQLLATLPLMAVDPAVAATVFSGQGFQGFYQDAKEHGADDRTASMSGLMGATLGPLQATMVDVPSKPFAGVLAKMLAGSSWKQGVAQLTEAAVRGGSIQGGAQLLQNSAAHAAGYDPNRPLDEGVWQQIILGGAIDTVATSIGMAGRRRAAQPPPAGVPGEVEIRTKPPAPAQAPAAAAVTAAAPQTEAEIHAELQRNLDRALPETAPTPAAAAVPGETAGQLAVPAAIQTPAPGEGAAPPVPAPAPAAQPLAEAVQAVRESQAGSPEAVLAAQGRPEERLETGRQELQQTLGAVEQPAPLAEAAAPPAAEAPAPVTGRMVETRAGPMPEEWVSPTAVRETGAPPEDPEIIRRIISAYQEVSAERDRISVPISDVIDRAGVPLQEGRAAIAAHPNVQLDEGDWSLAPLAQRQAAIRELGRERLLMAFPEPTVAAAARPEPLASAPMARMVGPADAGRVAAPEILPQAQAKQIVNRSAEQAGLEGRILYAANEDSLPLRLKDQLVTRGLRGRGQTQTIWDNRQGQLWVIGDAFRNAPELHRALIEEAIPRAFDHGQMPIATVHTPEDPRLGWWDPVKQQATVNTAQLVNRPEPLLDASKTAVHESVVHAGLERMFTNTPEGRAAYEQTLGAVRQRFDSTGMSQELAISRGFRDVAEMEKTYAELYGKSGQELTNIVSEELLATYAEEHFPTRASLEQSPRWYQEALGRLGSALRREFDWQLSDWDVQRLVRDSYAASRPGKTPLGVGSIPVRPEAIRPDGHAVAVLDNHPVTDPRLANVGQLEVGHPLSEPQMERLYGMLEGSGHPVGIIERPEGPIFVNYDERKLANENFHALVDDAVRAVQMLNIGAFDKAEYYNAIRERFGLPGWNENMARNIRSAGDQLQKIQADQGPHELMEQYKTQIADLLAQAQPTWTKTQVTAQSIWLASLLTGPTTHLPYWAANSLKAFMDLSFRNLEALRTGKLSVGDVLQTYGDVARQLLHKENWSEFGMQMATGYRQHRPGEADTEPLRGFGLSSLGTLPHREGLESTPLPGGRLNYLNLYKYVPRFLEAVNGLFYRGASEGLMRNIALREAQDRNMDPDQARRWAAEVMFGTEQQRADAQARAAEEAQKYNLSPASEARRVEELIREARPKELSEEANRFALHAFYREAPIGGLGTLGRGVQELKRKHPGVTYAVPFVNIAANALNEGLNWTPLGWWRARHLESLYENVRGMRPLFEGE